MAEEDRSFLGTLSAGGQLQKRGILSAGGQLQKWVALLIFRFSRGKKKKTNHENNFPLSI